MKQAKPLSGAAMAQRQEVVDRAFQELWFALAKKDWRSVVLVPADSGGSAAFAASSLAQVGKQLHELPVTLFVMANPADYWPAMQIVNAAASSGHGDVPPAGPQALDYASAMQVVASAAANHREITRPATGKVIVAIQPVVVEPLGLAVTQAADVVLLHVERGRTRLASARRTIELIGRERIAGCFLDSSLAPGSV